MDFDPNRPPTPPRAAATVILLREGNAGAEVLLLARHRKASFMARSFVFPGGLVEEGEADPRLTAARELFEEAGVLLLDAPVEPARRSEWRAALGAGARLEELLAGAGRRLDLEGLVPWAHWITPSAEARRFSARFFLATLPAGQVAAQDDVETVDLRWVTPDEALRQADALRLPPPQLRTLWELAEAARRGPAAVLEAGRARSAAAAPPILPRFAPLADAPGGFALLLPWDPGYERQGTGAAEPWPARHPLAGGPSRFVREGELWRQLEAPAG